MVKNSLHKAQSSCAKDPIESCLAFLLGALAMAHISTFVLVMAAGAVMIKMMTSRESGTVQTALTMSPVKPYNQRPHASWFRSFAQPSSLDEASWKAKLT